LIALSKLLTKMNSFAISVLVILLITSTSSLCVAARPGASAELNNDDKLSKGKTTNQNTKGGNGYDAGMDGFFGPGSGIPGFGNGIVGGGYGAGYGGPNGGYSRGGVIRPSVVCKERGPCYMKKLTCPKKCFTSYSRSGKGYGGGGGGGGCTMDCKK
ncbi:hypothetical protein J4G24_19705, partial [Clostridioides difficile]|nr:hypothetical protein [Clostridioides difficile]